uniref:Mitochondrial distribution/morphology family 35/apoptosis n=1 Tax=Tanacetum cinerariifolium TaxID=118510 RepID=A0A699IXM2_TANCI|nr:hypothetical protein [Tanacetum cinerariifolium]
MGFLKDRRNASNTKTTTSPCADLRTAYNNCFNRWYSDKFLKGVWDKEECVAEWEKYRDCLSKHLPDKNLSKFLEDEGVKRIPSPISE